MKVPYSKDNPLNEPKPQNIFLTIGPAPLPAVTSVIAQSENQGWTARFVVFAGMQPTSPIAMKQNQMIALYAGIICKEFNEGEEIIEPVVKTIEKSLPPPSGN